MRMAVHARSCNGLDRLGGLVELIATGFNMEHGGKVPKPVQQRCDGWLHRSAKVDERSLVAISEPRENELKKIERQLMQR